MPPFPSWRFREMDRGELAVDPVHDEFFKAQDLADALVRESIQNSLDARRGHSTVRVRFRFGLGTSALAPEAAAPYLTNLHEHLEATHVPLPHSDEPMPFLLIEDFGTRGLTGDPSIDPELESDESERNDFYYFWRNVGRSSKGELDRGRWGLGKAVFSVASRIRAVFGMTLRTGESHPLLLGQAVLKVHILDGKRIYPYGFFGRTDHNFPLPIENEELQRRFMADFGLHRDEPGLSLVVPFYRHEELRFEQVVASAIRQYFYPIIRGDLVVIAQEDGRTEIITDRTIDPLASKYAGAPEKSLSMLCALTAWSVSLPDRAFTVVGEPSPAAAPIWNDEAIDQQIIEMLRRAFESGDRLAFRVRLAVRRKKSRAASSYFDVFMEKDETLKRGEHHFIRRGITIPEVKSLRDKPVRALVVIDDEPLASFLGDAENPAHSDWSERADKVRTLYEHGPSTLRYVRRSIERLALLVARPPEGRMRDFLAEIFSVDVSGGDGAQGGVAGDGERSLVPDARSMPLAASGKGKPVIYAIGGGFTLRGSGNPEDVGVPFSAEVAYRTRNGNPLRKYSGFDFEIGSSSLQVDASGLTIQRAAGNRIEFIPVRADFHLSIAGFDPRRDLVVRLEKGLSVEENG